MNGFATFLRWWGIGIAATLALLSVMRWLWAPRCDAIGCGRRAAVEGGFLRYLNRNWRFCRQHSDFSPSPTRGDARTQEGDR